MRRYEKKEAAPVLSHQGGEESGSADTDQLSCNQFIASSGISQALPMSSKIHPSDIKRTRRSDWRKTCDGLD